jgi:hypothetical protein
VSAINSRNIRQLAGLTPSFASLDVESHRSMMAADALAHVRRHYDNDRHEEQSATSIIAVRRR